VTAQHRLDLWKPGTFEGARVVCLGDADDICRQWCADGCEEECFETIIPPPDPGLIAMAPVAGHRWGPYDGGCRVADWINNCGVEDTYADDMDPVLFAWDDDGETQPNIRGGLIEEEWTGDDYIWSYAEPAPVVAA
jgi:hypothetical protein